MTTLPTPYYDDGNGITIYHGDALDIIPQLSDRSHDLILTDPPYGVTYQSNAGSGRGTAPITNDGTRLSLALYRQVLPLLQAQHLLWFTRWDAWPDVWAILGQYYPLRGLLVWDKKSPGMGDLKHWGPSYEMIASAGSGSIYGYRDGSVLRYNTVPSAKRNHPTEKPIDLLAYLIHKMDPRRVIDPFMGSGSTLVAAKQLGYRAIGIEIEERYCEIAVKRLSQSVMQFVEPATRANRCTEVA